MKMSDLKVKSHVGRDLLQSAEHFRTDRSVVWEYVSNSLQYTTPGVSPKVVVNIDERKKMIRISDNGRGMDRADLDHFFTMHGENRDRKAGRIGRGMFGTGKSAAFAIGGSLKVITVKDGKRSVATLNREDIEALQTGEEIPVTLEENERITGEPNGTVVEISRIHLKRIDRNGIIQYIERNLSQYPKDVEVVVDHYECEFKEPEVAESLARHPSGNDGRLLGDVTLTIKVAKAPLDEELRGIQVFSHGNWHTTTLAGSEGKQMSEYIFGEIDVPAIEEDKGPTRPFDNTRSGHLNANNEIVAALFRFIGPQIELVRRELVNREKARARSEESKRLAQHAAKIAEILSSDFAAFQVKLSRVRSASFGRDFGSKYAKASGDGEGAWTEGGAELATPIHTTGEGNGNGVKPSTKKKIPAIPVAVRPDANGSTTGKPEGGSGPKSSPGGGFNVEHQNAGEDEKRGKYIADRRTIVINLDHPQVAAAYNLGGIDNPAFTRLTGEVAIAEYAVALAQECVDEYQIPDEALFDIRTTIDRVSRKFVGLYSK
jgi:histidine kinase/DNA gyrase B/HSP90-like ATPase